MIPFTYNQLNPARKFPDFIAPCFIQEIFHPGVEHFLMPLALFPNEDL